jgi:Holliday junction DNA helicase RuvA
MIGALKGTIFSKSNNSILLFVGGVGYTVYVTNTFLEESKIESETFLFIHSHIREDLFDLFGFPTLQELHAFNLLLTVSGIGPKTALTVITRGVNALTTAVQRSDVDFFTTIPRLGKKNAQKIIIELKQKLGSSTDLDLSGSVSSETKELIDGLVSMGFARNEAVESIKTLPLTLTTLEQKIRHCLKHLGKK